MTREQRREAAKARKAAAIAKKSQKVPEAGDLPTSDEESEDDDMPANPNHTAKARNQAAKAPAAVEAPAAKDKGKGKQDVSQLSRREREALQAQQAKERYEKLHAEGAVLSDQQAARQWADDWMSQTGTLPPSGNDTAAQLLGFKLQFYASDARDASDFLPDNLIHLAALLIKVGFISILDLYPHLYPAEQDMSAHKGRLLQAKKEKEEKEVASMENCTFK